MGTINKRIRGSGNVNNKDWSNGRGIFSHGVKFLRLLCTLVI